MALPKTAKDIIRGTIQDVEYKPARDFLQMHQPEVIQDTNGNGDDVFNASNIQQSPRAEDRHGYEPGQDEDVYSAVNTDVVQHQQKAHAAILARALQAWQTSSKGNS